MRAQTSMTIADKSMAERAGAIIKRWGVPAYLLRGAIVRKCTAAVLDYNPRARGLALEGAERALIVSPLTTEPDHEQDKLVHGGRLFQFVSPVKGPRPGDVAIYFDADVVFERDYDVAALLDDSTITLSDE